MSGIRKVRNPISMYPDGPPKHLDVLMDTSQLIVAHSEKVLDKLCNCEVKQIFTVYNRFKIESSTCFGYCRRYEYVVTDSSKQELFGFCHPTDCCACLQKLEVFSPMETLIGSIIEIPTACRPIYSVKTPYNDELYKIHGPCLALCSCICPGMEYKIQIKKQLIGKISRNVYGLDRKFTKSGHVTIRYPRELDVRSKVLLLGGAVLVNFVYYYRHSSRKTFWIIIVD